MRLGLPVEDGATNKRFTARAIHAQGEGPRTRIREEARTYIRPSRSRFGREHGFKLAAISGHDEQVSDVSAIPHSKYLVHVTSGGLCRMLPECHAPFVSHTVSQANDLCL